MIMTNTLTDTEKSKDLSRLLDISLTMIEKTDLSSLLSLIIEDAYRNPLFNKETDIQTGYITRTVLCVPMKNREGEIIGVLQVLNKKTGLFTEYDEWLFRTY